MALNEAQTADNSHKVSFWLLLATFFLIVSGIFASSILLVRHHSLLQGSDGWDVCSKYLQSNCDEAIQSEVSIQFGIPLAGWGIVHFAMAGVCLLLRSWAGGFVHSRSARRHPAVWVAILLCTTALLFGLWLSAGMIMGTWASCALCFFVHVINALLLFLWLLDGRLSPSNLESQVSQSATNGSVGVSRLRKSAATVATVFVVGFASYQLIWLGMFRKEALDSFDLEAALQTMQQSPEKKLATEDDPRLGSIKAEFQLVLFSDFECPSCREFAVRVRELAARREDVSVVFKHYPISTRCNKTLEFDKHPNSCSAARAAEASHRQGEFWPYHDRLFTRKELNESALRQIAQEVGLDLRQFETDLNSPEVRAKISSDIALGNELGLASTPTLYLNGKKLLTVAAFNLDMLLDAELRALVK